MDNREARTAPADPIVDSLLRDLKLSQIRAVRLLYLHGSLTRAAHKSGEPINSLKAQLEVVDRWFKGHLDAPIYESKPNGQVELTDNGEELGRRYPRLEAFFQDVFDGLTSSTVNVRIPCTSDCIEFLAQCIRRMPPGTREIIPFSILTAEFNPFFSGEPRRPVLSLGPMLCKHSKLDVPDYVEYIELSNDPIVAIANENLNAQTGYRLVPDPCSVDDLLEAGVRIVMPEGGVVWDFMNEHAPSRNWGLQQGRHLKVHDLSYGLKTLSAGAVRRGVMLVHGVDRLLEDQSEKYPKFERFHRYELAESTRDSGRAITALFYNTRAAKQRAPAFAEACEEFFEIAKSIPRDSGKDQATSTAETTIESDDA